MSAARSKSTTKEARLEKEYRKLLVTAKELLERANLLLATVAVKTTLVLGGLSAAAKHQEIKHYVELTQKVCNNARRRVLEGEVVSNAEKIFSIFEPHTELIKRDKQPNPLEFGHRVLVIEDAAGLLECDPEAATCLAAVSKSICPSASPSSKCCLGAAA